MRNLKSRRRRAHGSQGLSSRGWKESRWPPGRAGAVGAKRVGNVRDTGPSPPEGEAEPGPYSNLEEHTGEGQAGRRQQGAQNAGMGPATLPGAQAG